jgi:hypothetical protein
MNKDFLIILLIFGSLQTLTAQNKSDILIIDSKYDISVSADKLVKEISVPRGLIKKTKISLLQQCIDSSRYYNGNCFKVTYYDDNEFLNIKNGQEPPDYIRGKIYALEESEIQRIQTNIVKFKSSKADTTQIYISKNNKDSLKVIYEANFVFQYGGESKLTILPKVNLLRKHKLNLFNPYYGIELGVIPLFVGGAFSFSGICGFEKSIFNLETSVSHFRTTKISDGEDGYKGPFSQNLLNLKFGVQIRKVKLKIGTSFLLNENIPQGQERISLLDIGKINGIIYGIELQFKIK